MATIYHQYGRGDSTFICPQSKPVQDDSPQLENAKRRLSEQSERRLSEQRRRSSITSEKVSALDSMDSLRKGKLPTNHQLDRIMTGLLNSETIETNKRSMSEDGQLLLEDFQELLMTLQRALKTKNQDELFQSMFYHVRKSEQAIQQPSQTELKTSAGAIFKIAKLVLFNAKFRVLLSQILVVAQQAIGTRLEQGGKTIQENHAASANQILGDHRNFLQHRFMESEHGLQDDSGHVLGDPKDMHYGPHHQGNQPTVSETHRNFLQHRFMDTEAMTTKDDGGHTLTETNPHSPDGDAHLIKRFKAGSQETELNYSGAHAAADLFRDIPNQPTMISTQPQEPTATINAIISQLKEIATTVQQNPEYQQAISALLSLFGDWGKRLTENTRFDHLDRRCSSTVEPSEEAEYYTYTASREAKAILEDWAQGKSLDPIIEKGHDLATNIKQDTELQQLYNEISDYIHKLLKEPGYLEANQSTQDGKRLVEQLRQSAVEKYRPEANSILQEASDFVQTVTNDPISKDISKRVKSIHRNLWYDGHGHTAFKPQLLNDIRITLIPALIEQVRYVALPQIVYSDRQYEIAIENMILAGDTLMPDIFEIRAEDYLRFSPKAELSYTNSQSIHIDMSGIQTSMDDVVFYYKRKVGFPRLSDSGVVSLHTGGDGLKISMVIASSSVDQKHTFRLDKCYCHIDKLNVKVHHSKHNMLYKVMSPLLTGIVKRQMAKSIETKLQDIFEKGDAKITQHLFSKQDQSKQSKKVSSKRPGLFSHVINVLNQKIASI
ncbi:uncharacterized protein B0P05DRAFT_575954 [Gilbertella persicaria]|uniref:uncharacterized protein n=1 Tax=Gilbertella persicaria TaxID=101096 RepID=UPI00221F88F4|nr:uncharacterized protein B0P05DRAFT_575954 [Gilbertella persicaria]KAI8048946.1 hypothetical protein B0P05DRAFT_575954 [Gilbertella persicaria]